MQEKDGIFIGIDLGGTNIEAAAVQDGRILASKKINTKAEKGAKGVIKRVEKVTRSVMKKLDLISLWYLVGTSWVQVLQVLHSENIMTSNRSDLQKPK